MSGINNMVIKLLDISKYEIILPHPPYFKNSPLRTNCLLTCRNLQQKGLGTLGIQHIEIYHIQGIERNKFSEILCEI